LCCITPEVGRLHRLDDVIGENFAPVYAPERKSLSDEQDFA
jgi:hypothetical protein